MDPFQQDNAGGTDPKNTQEEEGTNPFGNFGEDEFGGGRDSNPQQTGGGGFEDFPDFDPNNKDDASVATSRQFEDSKREGDNDFPSEQPAATDQPKDD